MLHPAGHGRIAPRGGRPASAYTLTEVVVVVGIIVIIMSMAIPAFNYITGARSIEAAQNSVGALLARARNLALSQNRPFGVVFFRDPITTRCAAAIAGVPKSPVWNPVTTYNPGDYVSDSTGTTYYLCVTTNTNAAPPSGNWWQVPATSGVSEWTTSMVLDIPSASVADLILLPPNIGAQVVTNCTWSGTTRTSENYLMTGAIVFSPNGILYNTGYTIYGRGALGSRINVTGSSPALDIGSAFTTPAQSLTTGFGMVLYDRRAFLKCGFSELDPLLQGNNTYPTFVAGSTNEATKENWLDGDPLNQDPAHGRAVVMTLLVNRSNGTLFSAE